MNLPSAVIGKTASIQIKPGEFTTQVLDLAKAAGFGMIRRSISWRMTEPTTKGTYVFTEPDAFFANMDARGTWALVTLFGNNPLYETPAPGTIGITTQAGRDGFAAFAAACAAHYVGRNIIWEIWNEPNISSFWNGTHNTNQMADEYTALVNTVAPAMWAADPDSYVVAGSISALWSASFSWFDRCIAQGMLASGIKGVSVHPYGFPWPEQQVVAGYDVIRSKMNAAGASALGIVNTEVGYPLNWITQTQGFTAAEAPEVQGHLLARQQLVDMMSGIGFSDWYEFKSDPQCAIVTPQMVPLPAYNAAKVLMEQLTDYKFIKRIPTDSPLDYVVYMRNPQNVKKLAVWTISQFLPQTLPRKPTPHTIEITMTGAGKVPFVDCYGVAGTSMMTPSTIVDGHPVPGKMPILLEGGPKYIALQYRDPL